MGKLVGTVQRRISARVVRAEARGTPIARWPSSLEWRLSVATTVKPAARTALARHAPPIPYTTSAGSRHPGNSGRRSRSCDFVYDAGRPPTAQVGVTPL